MALLTMRRRPCEKAPTNEHASQFGDHTMEDNIKILYERPLCRKIEKEREIKWKSQEFDNVEFAIHLARMAKDINMCIVDRRTTIMNAKHDKRQSVIEVGNFSLN